MYRAVNFIKMISGNYVLIDNYFILYDPFLLLTLTAGAEMWMSIPLLTPINIGVLISFHFFSSTISPSTIRLFSKSDEFNFPLGETLPIFLKR